MIAKDNAACWSFMTSMMKSEKIDSKRYKQSSHLNLVNQIHPFVDFCFMNQDQSYEFSFAIKNNSTSVENETTKATIRQSQEEDKIILDNLIIPNKQLPFIYTKMIQGTKKKDHKNQIMTIHYLKSVESRFKISDICRSGTLSQVRRAYCYDIDLHSCVEVIPKTLIHENEWVAKQVSTEMQMLEILKPHPYFVNKHETIHDKDNYYVFLEQFAQNDLAKYCNQRMRHIESIKLQEIEIKQIAKQLFEAIDYLHRNNITHGDINMTKILCKKLSPMWLCDKNYQYLQIKLSSFKNSIMFDLEHKALPKRFSPEQRDEELFKKEKREDIWNACIVVLSLFLNKSITYGYEKADLGQQIWNALENEEVFEAMQFLKKGFGFESQNFNCHDLLNDSWLASYQIVKINKAPQQSSKQLLYQVRCGLSIDEQELQQLVTAVNSIKKSNTVTFKQLLNDHGRVGLYQLLKNYVQDLSFDQYMILLQVIDQHDHKLY